MSLSESLAPGSPPRPSPDDEPQFVQADQEQLGDADVEAFYQALQNVMTVEDHAPVDHPQGRGVVFKGRLQQPADEVYETLSHQAEQRGYTLYMQHGPDGGHALIFVEGVLRGREINIPWWVYGMLFTLTVITTIVAGSLLVGYNWQTVWTAIQAVDTTVLRAIYEGGRLFALPLLFILATHEMGHYVAARLHGVKVTPPFFIPLPLYGSLGTLGAVILIQSPLRNRKMLFDVGIAGPLAGLVASLAVYVWGLSGDPSGGYPIQWMQATGINRAAVPPLLEWVTAGLTSHKVTLIDRDLFYHYPTALAGWFGVLLTALNLLPLGQFDGGHMAFAMLGRRLAWPLAIGAALGCVLLGLWTGWLAWLIWPGLAYLTGIRHPPPQDDITPLGWPRLALGVFTFILLGLMLVTVPFYSSFG